MRRFDIMGMFTLNKRLGLIWSFEILPVAHNAKLDISAPHPLLFNRPRMANLEVDALEYSEFSTHFGLAYIITVSKVEFDLFAGPSFFSATTELIDQETVVSEYPFDDLSLTDASRVVLNDIAIGFHTGAGVAYYLTDTLGVSFIARFSRASIEVMREGGDPVSFDAGGLQVGGGIRIKF